MDASPPWAHHHRLEIEAELGSLPPTDGVRGVRCWVSNWTCCVREQSRVFQNNTQDVCLASVTHFKQKVRSKVTLLHPVIKPWELSVLLFYSYSYVNHHSDCVPKYPRASMDIFPETLLCPKGVLRTQLLSFKCEKQAPIIVNNTVLYASTLLRD